MVDSLNDISDMELRRHINQWWPLMRDYKPHPFEEPFKTLAEAWPTMATALDRACGLVKPWGRDAEGALKYHADVSLDYDVAVLDVEATLEALWEAGWKLVKRDDGD